MDPSKEQVVSPPGRSARVAQARLALKQQCAVDAQGTGAVHATRQPGNLVPNIGRPLCDSALVASSSRTSQCSASTPSATRTTSAAIQFFGLPVFVNRPWTIT